MFLHFPSNWVKIWWHTKNQLLLTSWNGRKAMYGGRRKRKELTMTTTSGACKPPKIKIFLIACCVLNLSSIYKIIKIKYVTIGIFKNTNSDSSRVGGNKTASSKILCLTFYIMVKINSKIISFYTPKWFLW